MIAPQPGTPLFTSDEHRIAALELRCAKAQALADALRDAQLQLEYIDERSPSGTTPAVVARITAALAAWDAKP